MTSSTAAPAPRTAAGVSFPDDTLAVALADGRSISVPLADYPRLAAGTDGERANWRSIAGGRGLHWPDLDEDLAVEHLLDGRGSAEGEASVARWRDGRAG